MNPNQRRLERIEGLLRRLIGEGPTALFRDARRLVDDGFGLESRAALIWHSAREIESAIHAALNPVAPFDEEANKKQMRAAQVKALIAELGLDPKNPDIAWWRRSELHGLAHRPHLDPPRSFTPTDWQQFLAALELILDAFEARYERMLDRLDALLALDPKGARKEVEYLLTRVPPSGQATALRHFLLKADERWLEVLPASILKNPPGRTIVNSDGGYNYPAWHVTEYLAKIAPARPREVHREALRILAKQPENPFVHTDLARAAASFPANLMKSWAKVETEWLGSQTNLQWPVLHEFGDVTKMLADAGLTDSAFEMGYAVLALGEGPSRRYGAPRLRWDDYDYGVALKTISTTLTSLDAPRSASMFLEIVAKAVEQTQTDGRQKYSRLWRSSIADDGSNDDDDDTLDALMNALVAALDAAATDPASIQSLRASINAKGPISSVFRRLALHLATSGLVADRQTAMDIALDPMSYTEDAWLEANRLVAAIGVGLPDADAAPVEVAIRAGDFSDEHKDRLVASLKDVMAGKDLPPIHGHRFYTIRDFDPPPSPVTEEQMGRWSMSLVITYLAAWTPDPNQRDSGDSLESTFSAVVKANAAKWSAAGPAALRLPRSFQTRYLQALREGMNDGAILDGNALVRLMRAGLVDGNLWHAEKTLDVRRAASWLLDEAFERDRIKLGPRNRASVWAIIEALLQDRSGPTISMEGDQFERLANLSVNHSRSVAVGLVAAYAAWVSRHKQKRHLPAEARRILEGVLAPTETSLPERFMVGRYVARLLDLGPEWTHGALSSIFPADPAAIDLRRAARAGYLFRGRVPLDHLGRLMPEYHSMVGELDRAREASKAEERLGDHILLLARIGAIGPDTEDGLLPAFARSASDDLLRDSFHDLGWGIWHARAKTLEVDEALRLRSLWEWLATEVREGRVSAASLEAFGWWFASGQFDDEWSLDELERLAKADVEIDMLPNVFERLEALMPSHLARVGVVAEAIVAREINQIELHGDHLPTITRGLLDPAAGAEVNETGQRIVSRMRARGFAKFPDKR